MCLTGSPRIVRTTTFTYYLLRTLDAFLLYFDCAQA
jgi:hypothetical protein